MPLYRESRTRLPPMSGEDTSSGEERPAGGPNRSSSSWEPYRSPETRRGGVSRLLRRYSFSITVAVTALAFGALIYFSPKRLAPEADSREAAPDTNHATLSVYSDPEGAAVIVGADTVGVTPIERHRIPAGTYLVSVERETYVDRDTVLTLSTDQSAVYAPQLSPEEGLPSAEQDLPPISSGAEGSESSLLETPEEQEPTSPPESDAGGSTEDIQEQTSTSESPAEETEEEENSLVMGSLVLRTTPESTAVELNGSRVGSTPMRLDRVAVGTHDITFHRSGYESETRRVEVQENETIPVEAALEAQTGHLRVLARPWGSIYINGQRRAENSDVWYETNLPAGTHTITARHPSLGDKQRMVEVVAADTQSVVMELREN